MAQTLSALSLICTTPSSSFFNSKSSSLSFSTFTSPKVGGLSIRCARVGGVEIPNNKRVQYSLQYIHGIGRTRALEILNDLKMENKITKDLSEEELIVLRDEVSKYMIEGDLVMPPLFFLSFITTSIWYWDPKSVEDGVGCYLLFTAYFSLHRHRRYWDPESMEVVIGCYLLFTAFVACLFFNFSS